MRAYTFDSDCVRGPGPSVLKCRSSSIPDDEHYSFDRKHHHNGLIPQGGAVVTDVNFANTAAMAGDDKDLEGEKDLVVVFYGRVKIDEWDEYTFCMK